MNFITFVVLVTPLIGISAALWRISTMLWRIAMALEGWREQWQRVRPLEPRK